MIEQSIETDRLLLREPRPEDARPLVDAVFSDPETMRYVGDGAVRTIEQLDLSIRRRIECLETHRVTLYTVIERATGQIIGDSGALPIDWKGPEFELAYRFARASWGKGYATEAGRAALQLLWKHSQIDRIFAVTDPDNTASQRVLTKLHFDDLGTTDKHYNQTLRYFEIRRP